MDAVHALPPRMNRVESLSQTSQGGEEGLPFHTYLYHPRASILANLVFPTRLSGRWIIPRILFCFFPLFITG